MRLGVPRSSGLTLLLCLPPTGSAALYLVLDLLVLDLMGRTALRV